AVAVSTQIFRGIKTQTTDFPERADTLSVIGRTDRLGRIFDDVQIVSAGEFENRLHVSRLPVKMDRDDGTRAFGDERLELCGIEREGGGINVGKNRRRTEQAHDISGSDVSERGNDDLIAATNAARVERE